MPTFSADDRFWNEYAALSKDDQHLFREARDVFISCLKAWEAAGCSGLPQFPRSLGVKGMVGRPSIREFAWASDGRCTWEYGAPHQPGKCHVHWRRLGTHQIYNDP